MGTKRCGRITDLALRAQVRSMAARVAEAVELREECPAANLLLDRLRRICCSTPWEDYLEGEIKGRRLPMGSSTADQRRRLRGCGAYPPGGYASGMVDCFVCTKATPPQTISWGWFCADCYPDSPDPSYSSCEKRVCECCGSIRDIREMRRLPICLDCNNQWLTARQIALLPSGTRWTWTVNLKEAKAYFASGALRKRGRGNRFLFNADDPRVVGGRIDEEDVLHDPWLGTSGGNAEGNDEAIAVDWEPVHEQVNELARELVGG